MTYDRYVNENFVFSHDIPKISPAKNSKESRRQRDLDSNLGICCDSNAANLAGFKYLVWQRDFSSSRNAKGILYEHMLEDHKIYYDKPPACAFCDQSFHDITSIIQHMQLKHKSKFEQDNFSKLKLLPTIMTAIEDSSNFDDNDDDYDWYL